MKIASFVIYVVLSVAGLVVMRHFLPRMAPSSRILPNVESPALVWVLFGGVLYLASFVIWLQILRTVPLTTAYPVAVGLTLCGTTLVSWFCLNESLPAGKTVGIALIIAGVVFVSRNS